MVTEKAAFEHMRLKGFVQKDCAFAGHSLGEYSALASILSVSSLVDVVFYQGITMRRTVEQDSENRSNYTMCVVNPSRISKAFTDAALHEVVDSIVVHTGTLLDVVNYNVEVRSRSLSFIFCFKFHFFRVNNIFALASLWGLKPWPTF